jgi:hypothetical protein
MKTIHYINGQKVNPPVNYEDTSISINFQPEEDESSLTVSEFIWADYEAGLIRDQYNQGTTGGNGIYEGLRHKIELVNDTTTITLLDGFIDLTTATFDTDRIQATSKPMGGIDWLNDIADSFDFEYLYDTGYLSDSDKVFVPYILNSVPDYKESMLALLTFTTVLNEVKQVTFKGIGETLESVTLIDSVGGVVSLIHTILYAVSLFISIISLLLDFVLLIIQPVKYLPSMAVNRQIHAACNYLGLNYDSDFLKSSPLDKLHIIPETSTPPTSHIDPRIRGYIAPRLNEQSGYFKGSFADLLLSIQTMFNARITCEAGVLKVLRNPKPIPSATFKLPAYDNDQFTTNASDIAGKYTLKFLTDQQDRNTTDEYDGTSYMQILRIAGFSDRRLNLIRGSRDVLIPFARAKRKQTLTPVEEFSDAILDVLDPLVSALVTLLNASISALNVVLGIIRKIKKALSTIGINITASIPSIAPIQQPNLSEVIDNRIGMLVIENDSFNVPKIAIIDVSSDYRKTKISPNNQAVVKASYLFEKYHRPSTFYPGRVNGQRIIYEYNNVEMTINDVINVKNQGAVRMPDGTIAEVVSCEYNGSTQLANFVVAQRKVFNNKITEIVSEQSGQ